MALFTASPLPLENPPPRKGLWRRWLLEPLALQLTQGITEHKIALSLAVGSLCAFFPVLGLATPLCVLAGAALRLNQPMIQLVNWLTAPLYLPLVFAFVRLDELVLRTRPMELDPGLMAEWLRHDPAHFFRCFGSIAGHALGGWVMLAPLWTAVAYGISRPLIRLAAAGLMRSRPGP